MSAKRQRVAQDANPPDVRQDEAVEIFDTAMQGMRALVRRIAEEQKARPGAAVSAVYAIRLRWLQEFVEELRRAIEGGAAGSGGSIATPTIPGSLPQRDTIDASGTQALAPMEFEPQSGESLLHVSEPIRTPSDLAPLFDVAKRLGVDPTLLKKLIVEDELDAFVSEGTAQSRVTLYEGPKRLGTPNMDAVQRQPSSEGLSESIITQAGYEALPVPEVAEAAGLSRYRIAQLVHQGRVRAVRVGSDNLVSVADVREYLMTRTRGRPRKPEVDESKKNQPALPEPVLTPEGYEAYPLPAVAAHVGWSTQHLHRLATSGRVRATKVGRNFVVNLDDVLQLQADPKHRRGRPPRIA